MITAVVTAIAITQREARREKAAKEAEAAAAAKKDILIVGAGTTGLLVALLCRAQGFTVTVVDAKAADAFFFDAGESSGGIVWMSPNALRVLERVHEKMPTELGEAACSAERLHHRRYKSGKSIASPDVTTSRAFVAADLHSLLLGFTTATVRFETKIVEYRDSPDDLDGPLPHGRPYALSATGEKFHADCIVACEGSSTLARNHVIQSAGESPPPEIDTGWTTTTGSIAAEDLGENHIAASLFSSGDRADVWVGEEAYLSSLTIDGGAEFVFTAYDLDVDNEGGELEIADIVEDWDPTVVSAVSYASPTSSQRLKIRQKPGSLVSRRSRKVVLFGDCAFTFPPHSPHLDWSYHVEAASTLAVCLRKAASVPLGLEVFTRLRAPRFARAMGMAQDRFNVITASAAEGELEAVEIMWDTRDDGEGNSKGKSKEGESGEPGWWEYDAEKFAEKTFDGVIDQLTAELLGKQKAMLEAQAQAEAEAKAEAEEEARKRREEEEQNDDDESEDEDDEGGAPI